MDKFRETQLPGRETFYNDLNEEECSQEDYIHAQNVWSVFNMSTLQDYHDLYLKSDVLLLSCIIDQYRKECYESYGLDQYRKECYESYGLDPTHYYTSPVLTWDAGLKFCKIRLELLQDEGMYMFMVQSIREGISTITHRHEKAKNKFLPDYNPSNLSSCLLYIDANNLYGWSMRQKLSIGGFEYVNYFTINDISTFDMNSNMIINDKLICNATKESRLARGITVQPEQKKLAANLLSKSRYKVDILIFKSIYLLVLVLGRFKNLNRVIG